MGVVTTSDVPEGRCFGPLPQTLGSIYIIAQAVLKEQPPDVPMMKVDVSPHDEGEFWLPFVRPARHLEEQNLEMCIKHGGLYYRALKNISSDTELLVWYSTEMVDRFGLLGVDAYKQKADGNYTCPYCMEQLQFPNTLMAHVLLKCHIYATFLKRRYNLHQAGLNIETNDHMAITHEQNNKRKHTNTCSDINENVKKSKSSSFLDNVSGSAIHNDDRDARNSAFRKVEKIPSPTITASPIWHPYQNLYRAAMPYPLDGMQYRKSMERSPSSYYTLQTQLAQLSNKKVLEAALPVSRETIHSHKTQLSPTLPEVAFGTSRSNTIANSPIPGMIDRLSLMAAPSTMMSHVANLAQNWCAKCNASFRMTSDLVYHMRSHHKKDFSVDKKKRDEKLRCDICGERFRERHHLTRHMTSHD